MLSTAHTVASAIARHGLRTRQTSPKSTDSSGIPSQKTTYTNVGAKFRSSSEVPKSAVVSVSTSSATETSPRMMRSAREKTTAATARGSSPPVLHALQERTAPEHAEQDEGDDEDDRRGRVEDGLGNREVANAPDAVGE